MTNPTPQVEACDREALKAYMRESVEKANWSVVMGLKEEVLLKHLSAHRHSAVAAAVAKREAEIVEIIREAERQRFAKCLLEDPSTVGVYFTAGELITKLQNGGGA